MFFINGTLLYFSYEPFFGGRIGVDMPDVLYFRITAKLQIHSDARDCIEIKLVKICELLINGVFRSPCGTTVTIQSLFLRLKRYYRPCYVL